MGLFKIFKKPPAKTARQPPKQKSAAKAPIKQPSFKKPVPKSKTQPTSRTLAARKPAAKPAAHKPTPKQAEQIVPPRKVIGNAYYLPTEIVDKEPNKERRHYAVTRQSKEKVGLSKIKTIKKENDPDLQPINHERYGLPNKSGVDHQVFWHNLKKQRYFNSNDKEFDDPKFKLSSHDRHNVQEHVSKRKKKRK